MLGPTQGWLSPSNDLQFALSNVEAAQRIEIEEYGAFNLLSHIDQLADVKLLAGDTVGSEQCDQIELTFKSARPPAILSVERRRGFIRKIEFLTSPTIEHPQGQRYVREYNRFLRRYAVVIPTLTRYEQDGVVTVVDWESIVLGPVDMQISMMPSSLLKKEIVVPLKVENGRLSVSSKVNGQTARMTVGTGIAHNQFNELFASLSNIRSLQCELPRKKGSQAFSPAVVDVFGIGEARLDNVTGHVLRGTTSPYAGVLGWDFFRSFVVTIDFDAKVLTLSSKIPEFESKNAVIFPLEFCGRAYVRGEVSDNKPVYLAIDTLETDEVSLTEMPSAVDPSKSAQSAGVTAVPLKLYEFESHSVDAGKADPHRGNSLGLPFLQRFGMIVLDHPNSRLICISGREKNLGDPKVTGIASELNHIGWQKFVKGDLKGAIEDLNDAIKVDPDYYPPYANRVTVRAKAGDCDGAIADNKLISSTMRGYSYDFSLAKTVAECYAERGKRQLSNGEINAAIGSFDDALKLNPNSRTYYHQRGMAKQAAGDHTGAMDDLAKAHKLPEAEAP